MWLEEHEPRINYRRFDELAETNPKLIGTSCPYCNTMITDGSKARNKEEDIKVKDLVELVAESMETETKS
jgi:Fe-S oxidoreductase